MVALSLPLLPQVDRRVGRKVVKLHKIVRGFAAHTGTVVDAGLSLQRGNDKLGRRIWHFSLPPAVTCTTATNLCLTHCYALNYSLRWPENTLRLYARSYRFALQPDFTRLMIRHIRRKRIRLLRIHVSGEFFSAKYIRKWITIATRCPGTRFFCYTRAWRSARMRCALQELASSPNMFMWLSLDRNAHEAPTSPVFRTAYMAVDNRDIPPATADLVFRVRDRRVRTIRLGGSLVCPVENGTTAGHELQCQQCRLCFDTAWRRSFSKCE